MTDTTTRIECACPICRENNGGEPLSALVPDTMPRSLIKTAKGRHGLVYSANDPSGVGAAVRNITGLRAG